MLPNKKMRALWAKMQRDSHNSIDDRFAFRILDLVDDCMRAAEDYDEEFDGDPSEIIEGKLPAYKTFELIDICDIISPEEHEKEYSQ